MHSFQYIAPHSLNEIVALLSDKNVPTQLLAGGTDLIVKMRANQIRPERVITTKYLAELHELSLAKDKLVLGAAVSCREIYEHPAISVTYPALVDSTNLIGGIQIQGRATVGGNLCNAAPSADTIPTLIVLKAVAKIRSLEGERELPVEDLCTAPGKTVLTDKEILVNLEIPAPEKHSGAMFLRFIPRNEMDIAVVNAAASVVLNDTGDQFVSARIAIGAVAPTPLFVRDAGDALAGKPVSEENIQMAAAIAKEAATPISDMRGTVKQRKHLVQVLTARVLRGAVDRAKG